VVVNRTHYTRLFIQKCTYDVKQCVWFLIVYLRFFMHKSKEYNGMDILDSIFSDQRQKAVVGLPNNSHKPITKTAWVHPRLYKLQKGALDSQPQVITFTSCLPMVGGSLRVLRLLPPLKWSPWYSWNIAESGVKHQKSINH
jgi:hypothetical protein